MDSITFQEQLKCVEREINMREAVYPRRIANNKMSKTQADREIDMMKAVSDTIRRVVILHARMGNPERAEKALLNLINQKDE